MRTQYKLLLAAVAVLLLLGGGGALALTATSDDDDPFPGGTGGTPVAEAPSTRPQEEGPAPPSADHGDAERAEPLVEPDPEPDPQAQAAPPPEPEPHTSEPAGKARRTVFPREKRKRERNDEPQRKFVVPPAQVFKGTGPTDLGAVDIRSDAIVRWTTKGKIELRFGREAFPLVAPTSSGQLVVPPYKFDRVRVIARGRWTIRITPQK